MTNKAMKYGLMIIAAVLLVALAFAGAASATGGTPLQLTDPNYKVLVVDDVSGEVTDTTSGTSLGSTVYLIDDAADWNAVAIDETTYNGTVLIFNETLDFSSTAADYMMTYPFTGKIYGNGKVITNFTNTSEAGNVGLIRQVTNNLYLNNIVMKDSTLESSNKNIGSLIGDISGGCPIDVKIIGCSVSNNSVISTGGYGYTSGIVGEFTGAAGSQLILNHTQVRNSNIHGAGSDSYYTGGILGGADPGLIIIESHCMVSESQVESGNNNAGLLIGGLDGASAIIENCSVSHDTIVGTMNVGGAIGYINPPADVAIGNCSILNCTVSGSSESVGGLVGYANAALSYDGCMVQNCCVSGVKKVGGLVGCANVASTFENCTVKFGDVSADLSRVGGLVGYANAAVFKNCTAESCVVAASGWDINSDGYVGGLVGTDISTIFEKCRVVNCSVSGVFKVGGLVGSASSGTTSYVVNDCTVKNCIVSGGMMNIGGLIGYAYGVDSQGIIDSAVENCTIVSKTSYGAGGLVGNEEINILIFNEGNKLKESAIRGNSTADYVGEVVGLECAISKKDLADYSSSNVTNEGTPIWLNNNSNADIPQIYIAKSTVSSKQGPEKSEYFNDTTADAVPAGAKLVTQLTGYGPNGQYAALAYVFEPPTSYGITITNATGTYPLTSAIMTVCGDDPATDGTAVLTNESGNLVLTLNGFKASNMTGNVPIIKADDTVQNLKIILKGDSNLTGDYTTYEYGLLEVDGGNLTIISDSNFPGKLLVNNTVTATGGYSTAIDVDKTLIIDAGANVTAIANSQSYAYAIYSHYNDIIIRGEDTVVEVDATSSTSGAYAIEACYGNIEIDASTVTATANSTSGYGAEALYADNDVIISGNSDVTATAEATGNEDAYVYAIEAYGDIEIDASTVKAIANTTSGDYVVALWAEYNVTISGNSDVTATAEATGNEDADVYAIKAWEDIEITGSETEVIGKAISSKLAITIFAGDNLTINSAKRITAIGTALPGQVTSFAYNDTGVGKLNIDGLADYTFSNASVSEAEPKTYAAFSNNWHSYGGYIVSNYTAVTIEKGSTPAPYTPSSSSKHSGSTVILSEGQVAPTAYATVTPTVAPTVKPTEKPATPTVIATEKPTTQATQQSPAPFVGILAGLGVAALVLRLRK